MQAEFITQSSPYLLKETRDKRWAVPYTEETINKRAKILLKDNFSYLKNKTVLDLGCHFGTFSYISLLLGAKNVCGVDSEKTLLEEAKNNLSGYPELLPKCSFIKKDVVNYLEGCPPNSFDTILCFGLLYYLPDLYHVLELLKKVAREAIIIDTFTAYYCALQGKDAKSVLDKTLDTTFDLPILFNNLTQSDKKSYKLSENIRDKKLSLLSCPTISLLDIYFNKLNLIPTKLDWSEYIVNPNISWKSLISTANKQNSHWTDIYASNTRVSYLLTKP